VRLLRRKIQIPSAKFQINSKAQIPEKENRLALWSFGIWNLFGIWTLELGIWISDGE
jgi:hypothetical protein